MRTIIDLPEEQVRALAEVCRREGISRAEAIRRAVHAWLQAEAAGPAEAAFGIWADREIDGLAYERRLRDEWEPPCGPSSTRTS